MDASTFAVGRVTLRGGARGASAGALRLRAASGLHAADLTPPELPPAAVLVVRRLTDPMPRRFRARHLRPRPEWERAVREALAGQARSAARPDAYGRIDPSATAVLFDDEAQAIACLVVDRAYGRVASAWWWASLLPRLRLPPAEAITTSRNPAPILVARAREAPAVLAAVARWGEAASIARTLTREGAIAVLQSVAREYEVPLAEIVEPHEITGFDRSAAHLGAQPAAVRERPTINWTRWVPPAIAGAGVIAEVQRLFAVALCLHGSPASEQIAAAPSRVPNPAVIDQGAADRTVTNAAPIAAATVPGERRWSPEAVQESAGAGTPTPAETTPRLSSAPVTGATPVAFGARTAPAPGAVITPQPDSSLPKAPADETPPLTVAANRAVPHLTGVSEPVLRANITSPDARFSKRRSRITPKDETAETRAAGVRRLAGVLATEGMLTQLGGVFYLMHALDRLQLPAAFERGWRLHSTAGPWGTLDLIARALLGAAWTPRDQLWDVLAHLAGWTAAHAGQTGKWYRSHLAASGSDPTWTAPGDWPAELRDPLDQIHWAVAGSRISLWSPGGYVLTHRHTSGEHAASVRRACRPFERAGTGTTLVQQPLEKMPWMPPAALPTGCPARLGRWAACAAPAVRRRLRLGVGNAGRRPADLLRTSARLYVTSSHIDVVFALRDIDLRVRRAGLDRDPGWKPAYGRVVSFHFE